MITSGNSASSRPASAARDVSRFATIFPYTPLGFGEPVRVWPLAVNERAMRFIHTHALPIGAQFLVWARSLGNQLTWSLYAVSEVEEGPAESFTIHARYCGQMTQTVHAPAGAFAAAVAAEAAVRGDADEAHREAEAA